MARQRIAILDNERAQLQILEELLESEGYAVTTLGDLRRGCAFVKDCHPALVILDLVQDRQPVGLELIRVLRADPETRNVAILVVSADTPALAAHADEFRANGIRSLRKPYDLDELLALVRQQLPAHEMV